MVSDTKFLDTWQTWGCDLRLPPVVLRTLSGGLTNRSVLLDADGARLVMRVNAPADDLPGVDRAREARIWSAASAAGLAPALLYFDPAERFIVTEYVDGQTLNPSNLDESSLDRLFTLLASTHALDVEAPLLDYSLYMGVHWTKIESSPVLHNTADQRQRKSMQALVTELVESNPQIGLCHHDPVVSNILSTERQLCLLDWEYATRGFVAMDYATLAVDWNIDDDIVVERTDIEPRQLNMAKKIYRYICHLWQETSPGV
jgi:thiamine kinase